MKKNKNKDQKKCFKRHLFFFKKKHIKKKKMPPGRIHWKSHLQSRLQQHMSCVSVLRVKRHDHQDDMWYTTHLPDGCTWSSESTSSAAWGAAKPLSHLIGWNVLHSFDETSRTHRLTTPSPRSARKAYEHPPDDWQWSKTTRRNRFISSAKCI